MKKITVLAAAAAMLAFAACNKEENSNLVADENGMVTFTVTGEQFQNDAKQSFHGLYNRIQFDVNDEAYANGQLVEMTPVVEGEGGLIEEVEHSFYAQFSLGSEYIDENGVDIYYPASAYSADGTVTMRNHIQLAPKSAANAMPLALNYQAWPMSAHTINGSFTMYNNIAVVAPMVKYGPNFAQALSVDQNAELYILNIVLSSTDQKLTGTGHIEGMNTNAPYLVMDEPVSGGVDKLFVDYGEESAIQVGQTNNFELLGDVCVAPMAAGKHLQVTVYFALVDDAGIHYGKYTSNEVTLTDTPNNNSVLRSMRTYLTINMSDINAANRVQLQDTPFTIE